MLGLGLLMSLWAHSPSEDRAHIFPNDSMELGGRVLRRADGGTATGDSAKGDVGSDITVVPETFNPSHLSNCEHRH